MKRLREIAPCCLVINDTDYPLTDTNEKRLKERLKVKFGPNQIVEEWVDGKKVNTNTLEYIF